MGLKIWAVVNILESTNIWMLYRHISPSGKVYIGITKNSTSRRWGKEGSGYKKCIVFYNAIQKYGWNNIKHEILFTGLSKERAKHLEIDLIRHYKNLGISYNITDGGEGYLGYCPSMEVRKGWSEKRKGRKLTEEWKKKLSDSLKGRVIPTSVCKKGGAAIRKKAAKAVIQLSIEGKALNTYECLKDAAIAIGNKKRDVDISRCCKGIKKSLYEYLWMYKSDYDVYKENGILESKIKDIVAQAASKYKYLKIEEHRKKMIEANVKACSKPILQLTIDNIPIATFRSISAAKLKYGYDIGYIASCCKGKYKNAYGYKWQYLSSDEYSYYKNKLTE